MNSWNLKRARTTDIVSSHSTRSLLFSLHIYFHRQPAILASLRDRLTPRLSTIDCLLSRVPSLNSTPSDYTLHADRTQLHPDMSESPAQQAARLRRERREAKIKDGGAARLDKITNLSGRASMYSLKREREREKHIHGEKH